MFGDFDWLYAIARTAAQFVLLGVHLTGLVICLRRWHVAPGVRWVAAGFLAFTVEAIVSLAFSLLITLLASSTSWSTTNLVNLYSMLIYTGAIGGAMCFVVGVRSLALTLAQQQNAVLRPFDEA